VGRDDTRGELRVEGQQLKSLINGKSYGIGELELVSLQACSATGRNPLTADLDDSKWTNQMS